MQNVVAKGWGYELWIVNTDKYCGKQLTVLPGKWCSLHYHRKKDETFYVIDGELLLEYTDVVDTATIEKNPGMFSLIKNSIVLKRGDILRLKPNSPHRFTSNISNLPCTFIEFSTSHSDDDSYRIVKGD